MDSMRRVIPSSLPVLLTDLVVADLLEFGGVVGWCYGAG